MSEIIQIDDFINLMAIVEILYDHVIFVKKGTQGYFCTYSQVLGRPISNDELERIMDQLKNKCSELSHE